MENELAHILEPLETQSIEQLKKKVIELKQSDGEGWAIGEVIERAITLLAES